MPRRRWWVMGGGLIVALLAWWAVAGRLGGGVEVTVEAASRRATLQAYVSASGEIVATRYADIGSSVMGKIVSLGVKEGDRVRAGQVLARIDAVPARSDAAAARAGVQALDSESQAAADALAAAHADCDFATARLKEAALSLERTRALATQGLAPASQLDQAQAANDTARAQVESASAAIAGAGSARKAADQRRAQARAQETRARDQLAKTDITSPIDGVVSRLQVREGEMVVIGIQNQPGTTLMTVSDLSGVNAEVKVAEADVLRLALGQTARVTLDALPVQPFTGRVIEIGASALPTIGTGAAAREFRVVIRLDAPTVALLPGMTCDAEVLVAQKAGVVTVPLQSVVLRSSNGTEQSGVFVADSGVATFTPVKTGIIGGLTIEVEGVPEGKLVVAGPYQTLRTLQSGDRVRAKT